MFVYVSYMVFDLLLNWETLSEIQIVLLYNTFYELNKYFDEG
jgi:hypothetical protein